MFGAWILVIAVTLIIGMLAQGHVKGTFSKFSRVPARNNYSGAEVAQQILQSSGIHDVSIHEHNGFLGDHYDPIHKRLVLSSENFRGRSISAIGVAAHECGHALQHQQAYAPLKIRMASVGVTNYATNMTNSLVMLSFFGFVSWGFILPIMAASYGVIMAFNLITLPVEYDASRRAKAILKQMGFTSAPDEDRGVARVLNAAALTYVAAFVTSMLFFLLYLLPFLTGRDD